MWNRKSLLQQAAEEQTAAHQKALALDPALLEQVCGGLLPVSGSYTLLYTVVVLYEDEDLRMTADDPPEPASNDIASFEGLEV
ncbi:MAG: hypothetical protein JNM52_05455 [Betaproteobacteria bacterium]|nr:hypothetical protein [Betaproteobacteria bacterium]